MDSDTTAVLSRIAKALEEHNRLIREWRTEDEIRRLTIIQAQVLKEHLEKRRSESEPKQEESEEAPK